jgi:hypothetical protein
MDIPYLAQASWKDLDNTISSLMEITAFYKKFKEIDENPITKDKIENLVSEGWELSHQYLDSFLGRVITQDKKIILSIILYPGYHRDRILFHELVHVFYGLPDVIPYHERRNPNYEKREELMQNNALVEWTARNLRSDSLLLKTTLDVFGLEIDPYDLPSLAASKASGSLILKNQTRFKKVKMDGLDDHVFGSF